MSPIGGLAGGSAGEGDSREGLVRGNRRSSTMAETNLSAIVDTKSGSHREGSAGPGPRDRGSKRDSGEYGFGGGGGGGGGAIAGGSHGMASGGMAGFGNFGDSAVNTGQPAGLQAPLPLQPPQQDRPGH